jgi:hypothetical protein
MAVRLSVSYLPKYVIHIGQLLRVWKEARFKHFRVNSFAVFRSRFFVMPHAATAALLAVTIVGMPLVSAAVPQMPGRPSSPASTRTFGSSAQIVGAPDRQLYAEWVDASQRTALVLAPRLNNNGERVASVFGTIPHGRYEGVMDVTKTENGWKGLFYPLSTSWAPIPVALSLEGSTTLTVELPSNRLQLLRGHDINIDRLANVSIIGHRGGSVGIKELMNSAAALERARLLGCSGVEIDVMVPFERDSSGRHPRIDSLRVHHPPEVRSELTGFDSQELRDVARYPTLEAALETIRRAGIPFVYLDPKVRWLIKRDKADAKSALATMLAAALVDLRLAPGRHISIGAETTGPGEAGDILAELLAEDNATGRSDVSWAAEITKGTDTDRVARVARGGESTTPPAFLSFNLLRIKGGGGGILGWFLRNLSPRSEALFSSLPQTPIVWTAYGQGQFAGALRALKRMSVNAMDSSGAVMTPFPHKFAHFLATAPDID